MHTKTSAPPAAANNPTIRRFSRGLREAFPCDFNSAGIEHYRAPRSVFSNVAFVGSSVVLGLLAFGLIVRFFGGGGS